MPIPAFKTDFTANIKARLNPKADVKNFKKESDPQTHQRELPDDVSEFANIE